MKKYEERKNVVVGIIMYICMFISYTIGIITLIPAFIHRWATTYSYATLITDVLILLLVIVALIVMLVRKRQSGFGAALPMEATFISAVGYIIAIIAQRASAIGPYGYTGPRIQAMDIIALLIIIPIVLMVIYFFVPNLVTRILAASGVGLAFIVSFISSIVNFVHAINWGYLNARYTLSLIISFSSSLFLYALMEVQIFASFKAVKQTVAVQPYAAPYVPVQTPIAPVQPATPQVPVSNEQILANFKNLLDQGIISQEQYDAKVKELS